MIRVNSDLFRCAWFATSTEETRYYLNGVNIEPAPEGGALLVATDGHRLIAIHDPSGEVDKPAIVRLDRDGLKACKPGKRERRTLAVDGNTASVNCSAWHGNAEGWAAPRVVYTLPDATIDGSFPDWRRVLPTEQAGPAFAAFNTNYLSSFAAGGEELRDAFARAAHESGDPLRDKAGLAMQISSRDPNAPALIRWHGIDRAFGVLMPIQSENMANKPAFWESRRAEAA